MILSHGLYSVENIMHSANHRENKENQIQRKNECHQTQIWYGKMGKKNAHTKIYGKMSKMKLYIYTHIT